ncbi:cation tolerance protein CutA [Vogesella sp. EB]|jgi:periplasmic divalent cation tolerance protein|uniref:Divalent cation tolerance protein n=2 Tax=Vogesella TaxID=57739 RepID=A0ABQ2YNG4_9NEIS|nr:MULTISPECIES: divalent-cation tolerance protein CutA [Vogesella]KMJ53691.1 cation tolerance protein CutA [Vogesella sp. EB]MDC7700983.1 divalent-cation tolerance protein CutA [Vogesella indigofera]MDC7703162.1 divalent-cation tolerance protein CutA [Vogesella indigofera]MDC7706412.1 divalent-cation tolerance protein CutA [Vogesella indigofera]MDC7713430.1 divalent-cation tolerance protein CutA [Vogesella margarita]
MEVIMVLCNVPDAALAQQIAETLVGEQLAACVNIMAPCRSVYRWQGKLENASEVPLQIKTTAAAYPALQARLLQLHPYEVPEIVALPLAAGLPAYLTWVAAEVLSSP